MAFSDQVKALETELTEAKVGVDDVLTKAGIDRSSWTRWKSGKFAPRMSSWAKVQEAAQELLARAA